MKKINVLVLITVMDRAGAETLMMNYLRNIDRNKIRMDFLINRPDRADYEDEIEGLGSRVYHMCGLYPGRFGRYKREFKEFLVAHPEYRIIHSHLEERSYFALKIAKQMGVPVRIVHAHSVPKHFDIKLPVRLYFRHKLKGVYTYRFACGEAPAKWLYGTTDGVVFMKNAIDTEEFSFDEAVRKTVREKLGVNDTYGEAQRDKGAADEQHANAGIDEETLVIGHIGRFIYEKNQSFVIDIFNNVNKLYKNSRLLLIGGGKSKDEALMKEKIRSKVHALGLDDKVMFLGVRDDISELMQAIDILLMPSFSEGFPVTLVEAQSAGLKCLVSDVISRQCDVTGNVTGNVQFMSLGEGADAWAEMVLKLHQADVVSADEDWSVSADEGLGLSADEKLTFNSCQVSRDKMHEQVAQAGFDIKENAKWLEKFYEEKR